MWLVASDERFLRYMGDGVLRGTRLQGERLGHIFLCLGCTVNIHGLLHGIRLVCCNGKYIYSHGIRLVGMVARFCPVLYPDFVSNAVLFLL